MKYLPTIDLKYIFTNSELFEVMLESYRLVSPIDPDEEQGLCDEKADAQVLVDGVAVALEAAEEAEGEEADQQAHQRKEDPNPSDDIQKYVVNRVCVLLRREKKPHQSTSCYLVSHEEQ